MPTIRQMRPRPTKRLNSSWSEPGASKFRLLAFRGQIWPVRNSWVLEKSEPGYLPCPSVGRRQRPFVCHWGATNNRIPHHACKLVPTSSAGPEPRQKARGVPSPMPKSESPTWANHCSVHESILSPGYEHSLTWTDSKSRVGVEPERIPREFRRWVSQSPRELSNCDGCRFGPHAWRQAKHKVAPVGAALWLGVPGSYR